MELGTLKSVIKVNLAEKTYHWDSNMKNDRFLQKGGKFQDQIFIFGGDFQDSFERYTLKDRKWRDQQISYKEFISPDDINTHFWQWPISMYFGDKFEQVGVEKKVSADGFTTTLPDDSHKGQVRKILDNGRDWFLQLEMF